MVDSQLEVCGTGWNLSCSGVAVKYTSTSPVSDLLLLPLLLAIAVPLQALNEFDLRATDWRKKLESQRGAVLAFETKNNLAKIAKWTMCALLAGADMVKLGYVSRSGPKDNVNHVILGTQVGWRLGGGGGQEAPTHAEGGWQVAHVVCLPFPASLSIVHSKTLFVRCLLFGSAASGVTRPSRSTRVRAGWQHLWCSALFPSPFHLYFGL